jgi:nucleoside-diphosphate-sugar epimerase
MTHSVVIGGAGFVGSWVVDEILKNPESTVTVIDNLISSERWNLSSDPRVTFIEGSASEFETFEKIHGTVDTIYQLACFHGNQSSIAQPLNDFENGLKTTLVTLEWAKINSPNSRIVYSGAGCAVAEKTWDSPKAVEEIETTSLIHDSPYSISKISGEMYCSYYSRQHNMDIVRVRFQNVYGPREILGAGIWRGTINTIWRNVIPTFIWKALHNEELIVHGNKRASRDFIFVQDVARGCVLAAMKGRKGEVYNLATEKETEIHELAKKIIKLTNSQSFISIQPARNWDHSGRRFGSTRKADKEIGFRATRDLESGLLETLAWIEINAGRIQTCIARHLES